MKRLSVLFGLVLLVALAACTQQQPQVLPTAPAEVQEVPTEVPPTAEPATEVPTGPTLVVDPALIDKVWQWERRDPNGNPIDEIVVPNPENYTFTFTADGTYYAQFDCNRGGGSYVTDGAGNITIEPGMTSLALCPPDSLDTAMKEMLGQSFAYRFEEDGNVLVLAQTDGGPINYFRVAGAEATAVTAADPALIDKVWQWERRDPNGNDIAEIIVPNPANYTLTFNEDGTFFARLDCNNGLGTYTSDAPGSIMMELGPTTRAMCPPDSLAGSMIEMFGPAQNYRFEEDGAVLVFPWVAGGPVDYYRLAEAESGETAPSLTGVTWQWLGTITPEEPVAVADSSRYTITFNDDGTAAIKADCNQVVATYTTDGSSITIIPGATTLALCPEDSQDQVFVQQLSSAAIYFFQGGDLYIDLAADAGTMRFGELPEVDLPEPAEGAPTGTVNAPNGINLRSGPGTNFPVLGTAPQGDSGTLKGVSEDGQWYVVEAPSFPDGQVWVAAEFVDATNSESLPVVATPALAQSLVGPTWLWAGTITPVEPIEVADPTRYQIVFNADGTANIKADCNSVTATYTVDGSAINIVPGASTLVMCPEDSQDQQFVQQLSNAAIFFFQGNELFIDQFASSGTMRFVTTVPTGSGSVVAPPATPVGVTFRVTSFGPAGAETPVIPGTEITALFDTAAGTVSGSSGCNSYSATLTTTGGGFTVGPIASTMMACPEEIMNQEAAFLAALGGTTAYQWEQQRVDNTTVFTAGQLFYTLADGTSGVINMITP